MQCRRSGSPPEPFPKVTVTAAVSMGPFSGEGDDPTRVAEYLHFNISVSAPDGSAPEKSIAGADADSKATVRVKGELDCHTAPQLRSALLSLIEDGARHVTLDLSGVRFVDSTGLSVLVGGTKRLRDRGGRMVVASPTRATRRLFEVTGLDTVLEVS